MKQLILVALLLTALPLATAVNLGIAQENFEAYVSETGLTIVTGTIYAQEVEGLAVTIYCEASGNEFVLGNTVSDFQGLFSVVYDNNAHTDTCRVGDIVWANIDNTNYTSPRITVEGNEMYDYADVDIQVSEFGIIAGLAIVVLAGLFIYRRRENNT